MDSKIKKLDLNLLKLFHSLMTTGSVSESANELNITQSATSHALKRLREAFSDDLFVVTKYGMIPTQTAVAAEKNIKEIIFLIGRTINANQNFNPSESNREFVIVGSEYFELIILPKLIRKISKLAPNCSILVKRLTPEIQIENMKSGVVDLTIGFSNYFKLDRNLVEENLMSDRLICVSGKNNRNITHPLDRETYFSLKHIYPSPWGDKANMVDNWLSENGYFRDIKVSVQNYLSAPLVASNSDALLTLPEKVYEVIKNIGEIQKHEAPFDDYPSFSVSMLYHKIFENEPGNVWLRGIINDICKSI